MTMKTTLLVCSIAAALIAGCAKKESAIAQKPVTTPAAPTAVATQPPAVAGSEAPAGAITGKVAETMDAAGYTYVKLATSAGDIWAAVPQTKVAVGSTVSLVGNMTIDNFESKTLKRKFDHIIFGQIAQPGQPPVAMASAAPAPAPGGMSNPHSNMPPSANAPKVDLNNIKVEKASGADAKTVAELYAAKSYKDAPVVVRGKVVKFLPSIMGKNWLHLRDGSGSNKSADNDLVVTTNDSAAVGDVVTVKGTVRRDKDFGAGYTYSVIVEEASVSK